MLGGAGFCWSGDVKRGFYDGGGLVLGFCGGMVFLLLLSDDTVDLFRLLSVF